MREKAIFYLERFVETAPPERYRDDIPKVERLISRLKTAATRPDRE